MNDNDFHEDPLKNWPEDFFDMEGSEDFPSAGELRKDLKEPLENPLKEEEYLSP